MSTNDATPAADRGSECNDQLGLDPRRGAFEFFFAYSRRGRGPSKVPTFERLGDDTYADDHTQRHWWTWQRAQAEEREQMGRPTQDMELAGMRALRNTHRTVSGEYSREQASACWHAMVAALKA